MRPVRPHENETAYLIAVRGGGDRWIRSAAIRAGCIVLYAAVVLLGGAPWALLALALPALGVYCALADALYVERGVRFRDPVSRFAIANSERTFGERMPNVSGLLESFGWLSMLAGLYAFPADSPWALAAQALAAIFIGSIAANILLDPAYYNLEQELDNPVQRFLDLIRLAGAPICAVLMAATATWAVSPDARAISLGISTSLLIVHLRVREIDRIVVAADVIASERELIGRKTVSKSLHSMVGSPLLAVKRLSHPLRRTHQDLYDAVRLVDGGFRETLTLDDGLGVDIEWPGVLIGRLRAIKGEYGCQSVTFESSEDRIGAQDRDTARLVIDDLAVNAAKEGARNITVKLDRRGRHWVLEVTDDAPPFTAGQWMRAGGSLERWRDLLGTLRGHLTLTEGQTSKTVTAAWLARRETDSGETPR
jgi:signal transduction histidine kinase